MARTRTRHIPSKRWEKLIIFIHEHGYEPYVCRIGAGRGFRTVVKYRNEKENNITFTQLLIKFLKQNNL